MLIIFPSFPNIDLEIAVSKETPFFLLPKLHLGRNISPEVELQKKRNIPKHSLGMSGYELINIRKA